MCTTASAFNLADTTMSCRSNHLVQYPLSLIPRLPHSGTRTLKLYRRGELALVFLSCQKLQRQTRGRTTLIVCGSTRDSEQKKDQTQRATYLAIGGRISHTLHSGLNNMQSVAFLFSHILIKSCLRKKDTRLSPRYIFAFWESLGTRLVSTPLFCNIVGHLIRTLWSCYPPSNECVTYKLSQFSLYVGGSSKNQTLCHMTQVLLKLRFTAIERLSGY